MVVGRRARQFGSHAVLAHPHGIDLGTGGIAQGNPHRRQAGILTGHDALDDHARARDAARDEVLIHNPVVAAAGEVLAQLRVVERARQLLGKGGRGDVLGCDVGRQQGLLVALAHISHALVLLAAVAVVGAGEDAAGRVGQVIFHIFVVACLEVGAVALGIDHAEVGLHTQGLGPRLEQVLEIVHRLAALQGIAHQFALTVHLLHAVVAVQVVGCRVHDGKSRLIKAHPGRRVLQVARVE